MTDEQIEKIVTEVFEKLLPRMGADGSQGPVIVVCTGATVGSSETVQQVRDLILAGFQPQLAFSPMADHLYGDWMRQQLANFPNWSQVPPTWLKPLREARAVVVPMLSVNTLSKLSLLIGDNQTGNLILHGLFMGKPVIVARNGADLTPGRAELGFDKGCPALNREIEDRFKVIANYGCELVDISQLCAATTARLSGNGHALPAETSSGNGAAKAGTAPEVIRFESVIISAGDVLEAHRRGASLQCSTHSLVTPLAREVATNYGVSIVQK